MYAAEQLFKHLTSKDLYCTLRSVVDEDSYTEDFCTGQLQQDFLELMVIYDLVFVTSDDRILLTPKGEKILEYLTFNVDSSFKSYKV